MVKFNGSRYTFFFILISTLTLLLVSQVHASTLPSGFSESVFASGLSSPTAMEFAPDGRLFVSQQQGALRVIQNGSLLATPFVTLSVNSSGERGLLGIAFDPNFSSNHFIYLYYTVPTSPIHNRVSRFTANGNVVVPGSEVPILDLDNLSSATNHNGGAIYFRPDGKLYVGVGENANSANSQTLSNRLGKLLRINSDGSIPTDNPFYNTATGLNRSIWALGLRNPFTFAFQRGTTRMFINDVGESTWEEINDGIAGSNYGWPTTEGETSIPLSSRRCLFILTARATRQAARLSAAHSIIRQSYSFQRTTSALTSSAISVTVGFAATIRSQTPPLTLLHRPLAPLSILRWAATAACII